MQTSLEGGLYIKPEPCSAPSFTPTVLCRSHLNLADTSIRCLRPVSIGLRRQNLAPQSCPNRSAFHNLEFLFDADLNFRWALTQSCAPQSVLTFPGAPVLKPWYWWSWPLLPLSLEWHARRAASIGYEPELSRALLLATAWFLLATAVVALQSTSVSWDSLLFAVLDERVVVLLLLAKSCCTI
jgi:hypothetical protein